MVEAHWGSVGSGVFGDPVAFFGGTLFFSYPSLHGCAPPCMGGYSTPHALSKVMYAGVVRVPYRRIDSLGIVSRIKADVVPRSSNATSQCNHAACDTPLALFPEQTCILRLVSAEVCTLLLLGGV